MPVRQSFKKNSYYHVYNQSSQSAILWKETSDYERFLRTVVAYLQEFFELDIYAYAILPNAYHFLFKNTEEGLRLSQFVRRLQISYAMYYKKKYRDLPKTFSVFPQRFMTEYIGNQENYDKIAQRIHLAPMYQNLVKQISDWPYTSAHQVADTGYRSQGETHIKILGAMPHDLKTRISSRRREDFLNF